MTTGMTRLAIPALLADTDRTSVPHAAEPKHVYVQRFTSEVNTFFSEIEGYYRQTADSVERVRQKRPGSARKAKAVLAAYLTVIDARKSQLQISLEGVQIVLKWERRRNTAGSILR
jgi:hypothetical protein